ncbi:MAG: hypothetical protein QF492_05670 [Candidatus Krumholzibacteria bacterium]|jgi:endoglucanase|nr:hypothetical protein [Candidatus Krumholzibacteria bacterium]MDP6669374.1 hypothetical protein [Candidatus Krumholzibacteria bacterium]MDP6797212.1 hypothetical protein [Candidatus Krumholzibacteria bacterium]MDP7022505.1 hypothetical protein [Candidatus Krumholzibacteria bacterium]
MSRSLNAWLKEILNIPTAPFHEELVAERVRAFARERGLRLREDRAGNLLIEYRNPGAKSFPFAFTCHMDHPGFEVIKTRGRHARLQLLGGVNEKTLRNSSILLYGEDGPYSAKTYSLLMSKDRRKEETLLHVYCDAKTRVGDWGSFDLPELSLKGGRIRARALDNQLSAALILALMDRLVSSGRKAHVYGLFTVAEEVGFVGAMEVVEGKLLPRKLPLLVMETSRELPSFKIGAGPVIRVGDRMSVFDDSLTRWLSESAEELQKQESGFRFQRALMPGGACEASLFQLAGHPSCALALALENYHNMGPRGAASESVSLRDAKGMLQLMERLAYRGPARGRERQMLQRLKAYHRRYRSRLR